MRKTSMALLSFVAILLLNVQCTHVPGTNVRIPDGVIDCGLSNVTDLAIGMLDNVNTCLGEGRQAGCDRAKPLNPVETTCSWKACLWNLAKEQGKAYATDALLCAVDQAGFDFAAAARTTGELNTGHSADRAEEFIQESGAKLLHREAPTASRPPMGKRKP